MKLVYLSGALVLGIYLGWRLSSFSLTYLVIGGVLILAALFISFFLRGRRLQTVVVLAALVLAFLSLGLWRGAEGSPPTGPTSLSYYHNQAALELRGVVASFPESRDSFSQFRFDVTSVNSGNEWATVSDTILVRARPTPDMVRDRRPPYFRHGDRLLLKGATEEPPSFEGFDWRDYLAQEGIHFLMFRPEVIFIGPGSAPQPFDALYDLRADLAASLGRFLPEPQASLSQAMLLGLRANLPSSLKENLADTGTTHLIAISGLHVGVLVAVISSAVVLVCGRRRRLYIILPLLFIWAFAFLVGLNPPVFRAAIMGTLFLWGLYLGRPRSSLVALSIAAAVMAFLDAGILEEVSFQLSFLAMIGIIELGPWLRMLGHRLMVRLWGGESRGYGLALTMVEALAVSLSAVLLTLPVLAFNFHQIPLVGIPATILVLPALPLILVTSFIVALVGLGSSAFASGLAWLAWPFLTYMKGVVEFFAWVPPATVDLGDAAEVFIGIYYGAIALALWLVRRRSVSPLSDTTSYQFYGLPKPRVSRYWNLAFIFFVPILFISVALTQPSDRLRVTFLDVGQGDSILIQTPSRRTVVIDGGPSVDTLILELGQRLPFWDRELDLVVLTHPDADHLSGLMGLPDRYEIELVLECGIDCSDESNIGGYLTWRAAGERENVSFLDAEVGQLLVLQDGITLRVLHPPAEPLGGTLSDSNNNSVVLRLDYGDVSFLFAGDIQSFAERYLIRSGQDVEADVLKVAHHGSKTSTTAEFFDAVNPVLVVVSVGADNPFGHPHSDIMKTLLARLPGENILLTSERGTIELKTDGRRLWLETER